MYHKDKQVRGRIECQSGSSTLKMPLCKVGLWSWWVYVYWSIPDRRRIVSYKCFILASRPNQLSMWVSPWPSKNALFTSHIFVGPHILYPLKLYSFINRTLIALYSTPNTVYIVKKNAIKYLKCATLTPRQPLSPGRNISMMSVIIQIVSTRNLHKQVEITPLKKTCYVCLCWRLRHVNV